MRNARRFTVAKPRLKRLLLRESKTTRESATVPCRVGITTDTEACREYWEARVTGFRGWRIVSVHTSRPAAKDAEVEYARRFGCESQSGEGALVASWSLYRFTYDADLE